MRAARHERRQPRVLRRPDQPEQPLIPIIDMSSIARAARLRVALATLAAIVTAFALSSCATGHGETEGGASAGALQRTLAARPGQPAPLPAPAPAPTIPKGAAAPTTAAPVPG